MFGEEEEEEQNRWSLSLPSVTMGLFFFYFSEAKRIASDGFVMHGPDVVVVRVSIHLISRQK